MLFISLYCNLFMKTTPCNTGVIVSGLTPNVPLASARGLRDAEG